MVDPNDGISLDSEGLEALRSLVQSSEVCLSGLETRIKREIEVIRICRMWNTRAKELLDAFLKEISTE